MSKRTILVCNDDGIGSPGLRAAAEAVAGLGDLVIVAPKRQQTAAGRSLTGRDSAKLEAVPYRLRGRRVRAYQIDCSPALLVDHAFSVIFPRNAPDLVVSGINYGENTGSVITASGTIGAALEAAGLGVPALAVSRQTEIKHHLRFGRLDWDASRHFVRIFSRKLLAKGFPKGVDVLSVNIPASAKRTTPWRFTRLSRQSYFAFVVPEPCLESTIGDGRVRVNVDLNALERDSDIYALVCDGVVSVTPLSFDLTARVDRRRLRSWLA